MGVVPRLENGWALGPWGFDSLSFRLWRHGRARQGSALLTRGGEPPAGSNPAASVTAP
jgi:hypothetical protein